MLFYDNFSFLWQKMKFSVKNRSILPLFLINKENGQKCMFFNWNFIFLTYEWKIIYYLDKIESLNFAMRVLRNYNTMYFMWHISAYSAWWAGGLGLFKIAHWVIITLITAMTQSRQL